MTAALSGSGYSGGRRSRSRSVAGMRLAPTSWGGAAAIMPASVISSKRPASQTCTISRGSPPTLRMAWPKPRGK